MRQKIAIIIVLLWGVGCGKNAPSSPTPTTPPAPTIAQAQGVWIGAVTQTSASSSTGECLGLFQLSNGLSDQFTASITQTGSTLAATASSQTSGTSCQYSGTAGTNTITLNATSCQPAGYSATCAFQPRDLYLSARSVTATVSGNTLSGTSGETWNVFQRGTTTNGLGIIQVTYTFTLTK